MSVAAALNAIANLTTQETTAMPKTVATLVETNPNTEDWLGDHRLYRLDPPLNVDDVTTIDYVVTVVVSPDDERVPEELRPAAGTTDGAWFAAFPDGSADNMTSWLYGETAETREVIGTATHESILALIPAEVAA